MDIGYIWDELKYLEVLKKHEVSLQEVVSACEDEHLFEVDDPQGHADRFMIVGRTSLGRLLQVVVSEEELPLHRIITAFDARGAWEDEYRRSE